jgi:pre-mRNA-splicing factor SYF1
MLQSQEKAKASASQSGGDAMQKLDRMTSGGPGEMTFVKSKAHSVQVTHGEDADGSQSAPAPANPDEIAIDDDDDL